MIKHIDRKAGIYHHVKDPEEANGEASVLRSFYLMIPATGVIGVTVMVWKILKRPMMPVESLLPTY